MTQGCKCPPDECHDVGADGCYFGGVGKEAADRLIEARVAALRAACGFPESVCLLAGAKCCYFGDWPKRGVPEGPAAIHFCPVPGCNDLWESEPTCEHWETM